MGSSDPSPSPQNDQAENAFFRFTKAPRPKQSLKANLPAQRNASNARFSNRPRISTIMLMQFLSSLLPTLTPDNTKIHLAQHNGIEHPMDVYLAGDFDEWQSWQSRKNFECRYVIGLVEIPESKKWLLAGIYDSLKVKEVRQGKVNRDYVYEYRRVPEFEELAGRLVLEYKKPRANYLYLKTCTT